MNRQTVRAARRSALFAALPVALLGSFGLGGLGSAFAATPVASHAAEFATVVSSSPVNVPMTVAQRVCRNERQVVPAQQTGAGSVIGMIAGGVIGNQFGAGAGRALATGAGAVAGAVVGNQIEANTAAAAGTEVPVQRCQVVNTSQQRTIGYDVMYEYHGQRYSTRVDHDPGSRLEVVRGADGLPTPVGAVAPQQQAQARAQYGQPVPGAYGQPVPAYGQPVPAYGQPAPAYDEAAPVYGQPAPVYAPMYYTPVPVYAPGPVYVNPFPVVNIGFGYYGGYRRHWR
jgi:uncharacterized protein YcfJ